jgi:hypothetical protein
MANNHSQFCGPAIKGLNKKAAIKVGIALDCAIMFGILEYISGNESLRLPKEELQKLYDEKIQRLQIRESH